MARALELAVQAARSEFDEHRSVVGRLAPPSDESVRKAIIAFLRRAEDELVEGDIELNRVAFLAGAYSVLEDAVETGELRPPITDVSERWKAITWLRDQSEKYRALSLEVYTARTSTPQEGL